MIENMEGFEVDRTVAALQLKYATASAVGTLFFPRGALQGYAVGRSLIDGQLLNSFTWETKNLGLRPSRTVGMRMRIAEPDVGPPAIISFKRLGIVQVHLDVVAEADASGDYHLELKRGSFLLAQSRVIGANVDVHVELAVTLDPVIGAYELRLNEQTEFEGANVDTGSAGCDTIAHKLDVNAGSATSVWVVDDVLYDDDFHFNGDAVVCGSLPSGAGRSAQFIPLTGQNYANVDDVDANDSDASYVKLAGGALGLDLYVMDHPRYAVGDPLAMKIAVISKLEAAGVAHIQPTFADDVDDGAQDVISVDTTSYAYYSSIMVVNPISGDGWRLADAMRGQVGVERVT
jgi:hypothetical protein